MAMKSIKDMFYIKSKEKSLQNHHLNEARYSGTSLIPDQVRCEGMSIFIHRINIVFLIFTLTFGIIGTTAWADVTLEPYSDDIQISEVEKGHEFMVRVYVSDAADLYGCAFDLLYDSQIINVFNITPHLDSVEPKVTEGDILNENGTAPTLLLSKLENNEPGKVTVGFCRKGPVEGVSVDTTPALLLVVHFRAVQPSTEATSITFSSQGLRNSTLASILAGTWDETGVTVIDLIIRKLDVNDDDIIDLKDLILVLQVMAHKSLSEPINLDADFSGDGLIGMAEAVGLIQVLAGFRDEP